VRYHRWGSECEIALYDLVCKGWNRDVEDWKERERKWRVGYVSYNISIGRGVGRGSETLFFALMLM